MVKKQIIAITLILFTLCGLFALIIQKTYHHSYGKLGLNIFTVEMFYCFIGVAVFFIVLITGAIIFRKQKWIFWSTSWAVTSVIVGILALWALVLAAHPTESEWGGLAQMMVYYLIGCLFNQAAVLLSVLALSTSRKVNSKLFSVFVWLCLISTSVIVIIYIVVILATFIRESLVYAILYSMLPNIVPLLIGVPIILFISKEEKMKIKNK